MAVSESIFFGFWKVFFFFAIAVVAEFVEISIKEALLAAAVRIHAMKQRNGNLERVLCRCTVSFVLKS